MASAVIRARTQMVEAAKAAGKTDHAGAVREGLSERPARSTAVDVPGLRQLARRPAHAPHGNGAVSGSACCVYGLTFTSHFYGARRTVGYVPFNSETLVTGKLFEDIREAVFKLADPLPATTLIVIINLCVPTASGVPLQILPKEINGVRVIGIDVPGFGVPTHAEAKDVLAGGDAEVRTQRGRSRPGRGTARRHQREADDHPARRDVPGRPGDHRHDAGADGPCRRSGRADPRMARTVFGAGLRGGCRDPSVLYRQRPRIPCRRPQGCRFGTGRP